MPPSVPMRRVHQFSSRAPMQIPFGPCMSNLLSTKSAECATFSFHQDRFGCFVVFLQMRHLELREVRVLPLVKPAVQPGCVPHGTWHHFREEVRCQLFRCNCDKSVPHLSTNRLNASFTGAQTLVRVHWCCLNDHFLDGFVSTNSVTDTFLHCHNRRLTTKYRILNE